MNVHVRYLMRKRQTNQVTCLKRYVIEDVIWRVLEQMVELILR